MTRKVYCVYKDEDIHNCKFLDFYYDELMPSDWIDVETQCFLEKLHSYENFCGCCRIYENNELVNYCTKCKWNIAYVKDALKNDR